MKRIFFFLPLLSVFGIVRLNAVVPVPFALEVKFSSNMTGTNTVGSHILLTVTDEYGTPTAGTNINAGEVQQNAWLQVGKTYNVSLSVMDFGQQIVPPPSPQYQFNCSYTGGFTPPSGYYLLLSGSRNTAISGGMATTLSTMTDTYTASYTLQLLPNDDQEPGGGPVFSGFQIGQSIAWQVGLGNLRSGRTAGYIGFQELDLTNSPASRDRLVVNATANNGEVPGPIVMARTAPPFVRLSLHSRSTTSSTTPEAAVTRSTFISSTLRNGPGAGRPATSQRLADPRRRPGRPSMWRRPVPAN
ncbi:MAG TPA: hypothetical protein VHD32_10820 [Candidatus Didemnitutus sp.]|nr:hypothetical protein [Candidatus Didemnitutus sp.]